MAVALTSPLALTLNEQLPHDPRDPVLRSARRSLARLLRLRRAASDTTLVWAFVDVVVRGH